MSFSAREQSFWNVVRQSLAPEKLFPSLITSSVVAMMTMVLSVSFVALIFVGPITGFAGEGTNLMLLMAVILGVFMAVFSSYAGTIAVPQDRVAPIVAFMATLIMHQMHGASPETIGVTVLAAIATSTLLVGVVLLFLGAYKLGNIVRFTPYPVIGGFLAGSGWLLLVGSLRVVSGQTFSFLGLKDLIASGALEAWIPCAIFGTLAYLAVRYSRHYLALPVIVFFSLVGFYIWLGFSHYTLADARLNGWILSAPPDAALSQIRTFPLSAAGRLGRGLQPVHRPRRAPAYQHHFDFAQHLGARAGVGRGDRPEPGAARRGHGQPGRRIRRRHDRISIAEPLGPAAGHGRAQPDRRPYFRRRVPVFASGSAPACSATSRSLSSAAFFFITASPS